MSFWTRYRPYYGIKYDDFVDRQGVRRHRDGEGVIARLFQLDAFRSVCAVRCPENTVSELRQNGFADHVPFACLPARSLAQAKWLKPRAVKSSHSRRGMPHLEGGSFVGPGTHLYKFPSAPSALRSEQDSPSLQMPCAKELQLLPESDPRLALQYADLTDWKYIGLGVLVYCACRLPFCVNGLMSLLW